MSPQFHGSPESTWKWQANTSAARECHGNTSGECGRIKFYIIAFLLSSPRSGKRSRKVITRRKMNTRKGYRVTGCMKGKTGESWRRKEEGKRGEMFTRVCSSHYLPLPGNSLLLASFSPSPFFFISISSSLPSSRISWATTRNPYPLSGISLSNPLPGKCSLF